MRDGAGGRGRGRDPSADRAGLITAAVTGGLVAGATVAGWRTLSAALFRDPQVRLLAERAPAQDHGADGADGAGTDGAELRAEHAFWVFGFPFLVLRYRSRHIFADQAFHPGERG